MVLQFERQLICPSRGPAVVQDSIKQLSIVLYHCRLSLGLNYPLLRRWRPSITKAEQRNERRFAEVPFRMTKVVYITTVDMTLRYVLLDQMQSVQDAGFE